MIENNGVFVRGKGGCLFFLIYTAIIFTLGYFVGR